MTVIYITEEQLDSYTQEIARLRAIIDRQNVKLREWRERSNAYDTAISTMILMITEELLEDHG